MPSIYRYTKRLQRRSYSAVGNDVRIRIVNVLLRWECARHVAVIVAIYRIVSLCATRQNRHPPKIAFKINGSPMHEFKQQANGCSQPNGAHNNGSIQSVRLSHHRLRINNILIRAFAIQRLGSACVRFARNNFRIYDCDWWCVDSRASVYAAKSSWAQPVCAQSAERCQRCTALGAWRAQLHATILQFIIIIHKTRGAQGE